MNGVKEVTNKGPAPHVAKKKIGTTYGGAKEQRFGQTCRNVSRETGTEREAGYLCGGRGGHVMTLLMSELYSVE
jgi:hypothetical protein